jgi:hypothetical protein
VSILKKKHFGLPEKILSEMSLLLMFLESTKYLNEFMISEQHVSKSWYQVTFYSAGILTKCLTTFCGQRNKLAICQRYTKLCFDIDLMK